MWPPEEVQWLLYALVRDKKKDIKASIRIIAAIMNGEVKPCRSFLAGNNYFGRVRLEYQRPDLHQEVPATYCLSVQVFSALGSTLEEHDERYKRIKNIKMNSIRSQYSQAGQSSI